MKFVETDKQSPRAREMLNELRNNTNLNFSSKDYDDLFELMILQKIRGTHGEFATHISRGHKRSVIASCRQQIAYIIEKEVFRQG